jgi:hypothetical protein
MGVDDPPVWGATFLDCASEAERSLRQKEAEADGVVSFLSRREATAAESSRGDQRELGFEESGGGSTWTTEKFRN